MAGQPCGAQVASSARWESEDSTVPGSADRRRPLRPVLFILLGATWLTLLLSACGSPSVSVSSEADVAAVFCLSPAERPRLVAAAAALGLARPGATGDRVRVGEGDMSVETWRNSSQADFDRSCAALLTATQLGQTPANRTGATTSVLNVLLPVVVGAMLAWLTAEWRDTTTRNRSSADALRSSARTFLHACDDFVRDWTGTTGNTRPSDQQLHESRRELAVQLRHVETLRPRWTEPRRLEDALYTHFGDDLTRHWLSQDQPARQDRAEKARSLLRKLDADVDRVAYSIERLNRRHRAMRGSTLKKAAARSDVEATS